MNRGGNGKREREREIEVTKQKDEMRVAVNRVCTCGDKRNSDIYTCMYPGGWG